MIQKIADGRTDLVFDHVESTGKATDTDANGVSLLKWCAYYGDVSAMKFLMSKGAELADLGENYDLNGAAFHGHWQLCQFLVEEGADVNYVLPDSGETALHNAICKPNHPASNLIIRLLVSNGADPNARTTPGAESGAFMRDVRTRGETPLHRAAAFGNEETIQLLLGAGAEKSARDVNGDSPITWASWHQRTGGILSLLAYGDYHIHALHIKKLKSDHGYGWGGGTSHGQLGEIHLE